MLAVVRGTVTHNDNLILFPIHLNQGRVPDIVGPSDASKHLRRDQIFRKKLRNIS